MKLKYKCHNSKYFYTVEAQMILICIILITSMFSLDFTNYMDIFYQRY